MVEAMNRAGRAPRMLRMTASIIWLVLIVARGSAQNDPGGLDLQITRVSKLPALGDSKATEVEVRWTAQVPRAITLDGFEVTLEVSYASRPKAIVTSGRLKPSARTSILKLPPHTGQQSSAEPSGFKASVKASFRAARSATVTSEFEAAQPGRPRAGRGETSGPPFELAITEARVTAQDCPPGQACVDVKWTANAPRNITIDEFAVTIETRHKDGSRRTASRLASGSDRRARITIGAASSEITSMIIGLQTGFFSADSKTVTRQGSF
ncbi:MAG TPA: hypothetical protein VNO14_06975 [Blastocatellia bacterium]|nr:hypothetical protein [Blastocatellia bacterium]